jgi:hypothetical protein
MPLLASNFPDPLGCCVTVLIFPIGGFAWILFQVRSVLVADRISWVSLVLITLYAPIAGLIVFTSVKGFHELSPFGRFMFYVCLAGLVLQPLTIGFQIYKAHGDRPRRPRRDEQPVDPEDKDSVL